MDTLNHGLMSGVLHALVGATISLEISIILGIIGFLSGVLPDVISELKARFGDNGYTWYNECHTFKVWWINIIPGALLHIWIDQYGHGEGKRWYSGIWYKYFLPWRYRERMWLETVTWIFNLICLFILFKIFN